MQQPNTTHGQQKNGSKVQNTKKVSSIELREIIDYIAAAMEPLRDLETRYKNQLNTELIHLDQ